jgi:hypothetical protein
MRSPLIRGGASGRVQPRPEGQSLSVTNSYVELAPGMNVLDEKTGQYVPAQAQWQVVNASGHFVAAQTQFKVILSPNPAEAGAVHVLTPDGVELRSSVRGLALVDQASGKSVMLAEVKGGKAEWTAPEEVVFRDAFDGCSADLRYRISPSRFEQDLIVREQIPPESLVAWGLNPLSTRLVILTEFFDAPEPSQARRQFPRADKGELADYDLSFGAMTIGAGSAFAVETEEACAPEPVPVGKAWELLEGRRFLTESVDYTALGPLFSFNGCSSTARCEHLTVNLATWANYNGTCSLLYLTNSLLAGVTNSGTLTVTNATVVLASAEGIFQGVGQGSNYLAAGSPYRNWANATTNLNADLAKDLQEPDHLPAGRALGALHGRHGAQPAGPARYRHAGPGLSLRSPGLLLERPQPDLVQQPVQQGNLHLHDHVPKPVLHGERQPVQQRHVDQIRSGQLHGGLQRLSDRFEQSWGCEQQDRPHDGLPERSRHQLVRRVGELLLPGHRRQPDATDRHRQPQPGQRDPVP